MPSDLNAPVVPLDTEAVTGNSEAASAGTASTIEERDTTVVGFGGDPENGPADIGTVLYFGSTDTTSSSVTFDTSASVDNRDASELTSTNLTATIPTTNVDQPLGVMPTDNPYVAPALPAPVSIYDTTKTDKVSGALTPDPDTLDYSGTLETPSIGFFDHGTLVPQDAPAAPDVWSGDRRVYIEWDIIDDPSAEAPVQGYYIRSTRGRTYIVPKASADNGPYMFAVLETEPDVDENESADINDLIDTRSQFQVAAFNINGTGPMSDLSSRVDAFNAGEDDSPGPSEETYNEGVYDPYGNVTWGVPGSPTNVYATVHGPSSIKVWWTAPPVADRQPVLGFGIRTLVNNVVVDTTYAGSGGSTYKTVWGLSEGDEYTFKVFAYNTNGNGRNSAQTEVVIPADAAPGAPRNLSAGTGSGIGEVDLEWNAPWYDGGPNIDDYEITAYLNGHFADSQFVGDDSTNYTFTGLTPASLYTFKVAAINSIGTGPKSPESNAATAQD